MLRQYLTHYALKWIFTGGKFLSHYGYKWAIINATELCKSPSIESVCELHSLYVHWTLTETKGKLSASERYEFD